ncbi:MAG: L-threonylcarbamoyladenylate synthase [Treponema sp.]|nr:L-threonylcarbamoyladenylate synthase [Treponema sp.]
MNFFKVSPESLKQGAEILKNGGLVAFPTETVYGLGADAFNSQALVKVFEVKGRPSFDPLIIHIAAIETLEKAANLSLLKEETRKKLYILAENFWPGPLSIILPKSDKIPGIATAGLQTAAFRLPGNETAIKLISLSTGAVAAPSANLFGGLSPTRAEHVQSVLGEKIDMILDGGHSRIGLESTVLDITGDVFRILRPGGTPKEAIERLIGKVQIGNEIENNNEENGQSAYMSPGQLKSHYAPRTPLNILTREEIINKVDIKSGVKELQRNAFLFFDGEARDTWLNKLNTQNPPKTAIIKVLSENGGMLEAASRLFEILHELDDLNVLQIFAQLVPNEGLGEAINDRLKRASSK